MKNKYKIFIIMLVFFSCNLKKNDDFFEYDSELKITKYEDKDIINHALNDSSDYSFVDSCNCFYVIFEGGYKDDSVKAYVNDELLFSEVISTNFSTSTTNRGFKYKYESNGVPLVLKVNDGKIGFQTILDEKFRQLYVYRKNHKWRIIYDNSIPTYE